MLEIKSEKYKDLSYVLAAERYCSIHLLAVMHREGRTRIAPIQNGRRKIDIGTI